MYNNKYLKFILIYSIAICHFQYSQGSILSSMDVLFVVDDCVLPDTYKHHLNSMLVSMVEKVLESDSKSRTGFVFYSEHPSILWSFNDEAATSRDTAVKLITDKISSSKSKKSCLAGGIGQAYKIFKQHSQRTKILIVVSHQVENCGHHDQVIRIARNMTASDVFIVSVAIGKDANTAVMEQIASSPKLYYHMVDYTQAENIVHVVMEKLSILGGSYIPIPPIKDLDKIFMDEKFCESFKSDLQILVDSSNYVPDDLFELMKKGVHQILMNFHGNVNDRRSSLTFFNAIPHQLWGLGSEESRTYNKTILLNYKRPTTGGGDICISNAFNHTVDQLFDGSKSGTNKKVVLLLTTGENTCSQQNQAWFQAARLKNLGATIIVVGIGPAGMCDSLSSLASGGVNYIHINDVIDMSGHMKKVVDKVFTYSTNGMKMLNNIMEKFKRDEISSSGSGAEEIKKQMELRYVILLNTAGTVSDQSFFVTKSAATQLVEKLTSDVISYKIVVGTFSNRANLLWNFDNQMLVNNVDAAKNRINLLTKDSSEESCIAGSMESVLNDAFLTRETHKYTSKFLFLISATNQKCADASTNELMDVSNKYIEHNVQVLTIGVGVGINPEELRIITSKGYGYVELTDPSSTSVGVEITIKMKLEYQTKYQQTIEKINTNLDITERDKDIITEKISREVEVNETHERTKDYVPNRGFDIGIIIESSCQIDQESFTMIKTKTLAFMKKFYTNFYGTKFSFATYSNTFVPKYYFNYNASFNLEDATTELNGVTLNTECQSCLSIGLQGTNGMIFHPGFERPNVPRALITLSFSSDQCNGVQGIRYYASKIKVRGIQMFSVALGGKTATEEVELAGTTSKNDHYIYVSSSYHSIVAIYEKIYTIITQRQFEMYVPSPGDDIKPSTNDNVGVTTKKMIDIVVIMDVSEQSTYADIENMKATLIAMYKNLKIGSKAIKISLITVSSKAIIHWIFSFGLESVDLRAAEIKLVSLSISKSPQSCIFEGFIEGSGKILGSVESRSEADKLFIFFGSGETNCDYDYLITITDHTKKFPMTIASVGFGNNLNEKNLIEIASSAGNYFKSEDIMTLVDILNRWADGQIELRIDKELYVIQSEFLINQRKKNTIMIDEYITKEVDIITKTVIDLVIVLNAKGPGVNIKNNTICFVKALYEFLQPQKDKINIAFVMYGAEANILWHLNSQEAITLEYAIGAIERELFPLLDEKVCVEKSFDLISSTILTSELRKMSKKVVLHITDYQSNCGNDTVIFESMKAMKLSRMLFFSVGISGRVHRNLINTIASDKSTQFFFTSFSELCRMAARIGKLIKDISVTNVKTSTDVVSKNDIIYINDLKLKQEDETTTTTAPSTTPTIIISTTPGGGIVDVSTTSTPIDIDGASTTTSTAPIVPPFTTPNPTNKTIPSFYSIVNKNIQTNTGGNINISIPYGGQGSHNQSIQHIHNINNTVHVLGGHGLVNNGSAALQPIFNPVFNPIINVGGAQTNGSNASSNSNRPLPTHIKINFCPVSKFAKLGCVDDASGVDFPFEIGGDICKNNCHMSRHDMQSLACNCAAEAQRRELKSFGITNTGACYGSNLARSKLLFVPSSYCDTNIRQRCSMKRSLCLGGRNSLFAFEVDLD